MTEVPDLRLGVVTAPEDVSSFWDWLTGAGKGRDLVAVDTETTGLDWWSPDFRVRLVQFGDEKGGWAIPYEGWPGLARAALEWCAANRVQTILHNAAYDWQALNAAGATLDWSLVGDTSILAHLGNHAEQPVDLKSCSVREFGPWAALGQRILDHGMREQGWSWATVPEQWQGYSLYSVVDTCLTAALWRRWEGRRRRYGHLHDLEVATARIGAQMALQGVPVDCGYLMRAVVDFAAREDRIADRLREIGVGRPGQNAQVAEALRRDGIELPRTPTGKYSVAADVLATAREHPVAAGVLDWRRLHRTRVNYLEALLRSAGQEDGVGVVHPDIRTCQARTGRMSIAAPPLQQLPRDDLSVRDAIVPRRDDEVLVSADFSQIEMRLFARLTRDEALCEVFRTSDETGSDFFVEVGRDVYQEPGFVKKDRRRSLIKSVCYGAIYTAGIETMAATAEVPVADMVPVRRALSDRYPSMRTLGQEMIKQSYDEKRKAVWWLRSPYGRVFSTAVRNDKRILVNHLMQGHAAEILKTALVRLDAAGLGPYMVLPIHDELVASVPKSEAEEIRLLMGEIMSAVVEPGESGVRIPAEPSLPVVRLGDVKR